MVRAESVRVFIIKVCWKGIYEYLNNRFFIFTFFIFESWCAKLIEGYLYEAERFEINLFRRYISFRIMYVQCIIE